MGDVPVPASSALLAIVRWREEAHRVSNVLDSLGQLQPKPMESQALRNGCMVNTSPRISRASPARRLTKYCAPFAFFVGRP
jgi:hypothetical protein